MKTNPLIAEITLDDALANPLIRSLWLAAAEVAGVGDEAEQLLDDYARERDQQPRN